MAFVRKMKMWLCVSKYKLYLGKAYCMMYVKANKVCGDIIVAMHDPSSMTFQTWKYSVREMASWRKKKEECCIVKANLLKPPT